MTRAAVLTEPSSPMTVRDIELREPGADEVRVRLAAAGVCHSDLSLSNGTLRQPVPAVLGHEGAGTVEAVGEGVTGVAVGDHVVLNWQPPCRECWFCRHGEPWLCEHGAAASGVPHATLDGTDVYPGLGTGAFAEATVVPARAVIPVPADVPLDRAALLGCAVLTGVGAVVHAGHAQAGESVAVIGLGGVGLSALQGARLAGAERIIAVDVNEAKQELAVRNGATDFLVAGDDLGKRIRGLTDGRGADLAVECVGRSSTIRTAWSITRRGGRAVVVGLGRNDDRADFGALELFHFARSLTGCVYGSVDPDVEVPALVEHWQAGRLDLDALVTGTIGLDGVDDAFAAMSRGEGARTVVLP